MRIVPQPYSLRNQKSLTKNGLLVLGVKIGTNDCQDQVGNI